MPSPAGAVTVLLPLYLHLSALELPSSKGFVLVYIAYVLLIAFLMASPIPHFSGKRVGKVSRDLVIPLLFGAGVTLLLLAIYPMEVLTVLSLAYLALIPVGMRRYKTLARAEAERKNPPAATPTA
jgi:CDP-diacylglycerol--serine O-phosphatidyltransferase